MFVKFAVFLVAVALAFVIVMIVRQKSGKASDQNGKGDLPKRKIDWSESLNNLTLQELEQKLLDLEEQKISASSGFIDMNSGQKNDAMSRASNINGKIEKVKEAIKSFH